MAHVAPAGLRLRRVSIACAVGRWWAVRARARGMRASSCARARRDLRARAQNVCISRCIAHTSIELLMAMLRMLGLWSYSCTLEKVRSTDETGGYLFTSVDSAIYANRHAVVRIRMAASSLFGCGSYRFDGDGSVCVCLHTTYTADMSPPSDTHLARSICLASPSTIPDLAATADRAARCPTKTPAPPSRSSALDRIIALLGGAIAIGLGVQQFCLFVCGAGPNCGGFRLVESRKKAIGHKRKAERRVECLHFDPF